jgi:DNA modification methylase
MKPSQFLDQTAAVLQSLEAEIVKLDGKLVDQDIAARSIEAKVGLQFAEQVDEIEAALRASGRKLNVDQWCKQSVGVDASTMRRRKRLYRLWPKYEAKRREMGQCGQSGLLFALSLVQDVSTKAERIGKAVPVRSQAGTRTETIEAEQAIPNCQFITGGALKEIPKLATHSVNVIVTSPPYWPTKRSYGGKGIGFEDTLEKYIFNLVAVFHQARRVLRDDGTLWISIDDSYQDGNLLFIPSRLGEAMKEDGWVCRSEIIWRKRGGGRPDSVVNRPIKDHEKVLMLTKRRNGYHYDGDPIRVPLAQPYSTTGRSKPGVYRRDLDRTSRVWGNPMGRSAGSVWEITPSHYAGSHAATMPLELVQRCLSVSCPENGSVLDCFGGAGTTALVALQLGHHAITIDINPAYTKEARQRIAKALDVGSFESAAD